MLQLVCISLAAKAPPSIILIVADDLGWNDVSFHGSQQIPTPNIDTLAGAGVTLDRYYVQPVCSPTRSTLLTGRHVIHTGIYDPDCGPGNTNAVPTQFSMLPTWLEPLGYAQRRTRDRRRCAASRSTRRPALDRLAAPPADFCASHFVAGTRATQ